MTGSIRVAARPTGPPVCGSAGSSSRATAAMFQKPEDGFDTFAPENVAPLVGWLASPLAHNVSGQVFVIWAKQVTLANAPRLDTRFESDARWTVESLQEKLGPHFASHEPVKDGFTLQPG